MKISKILYTAIFTLIFSSLSAQDLHFTMFDMAPIYYNPAHTGAYEGTYRISGIYRDQWGIGGSFGAFNGTYKTPTVAVDAPLLMLGKKAWLGAGLMFASDVAGQGGLNVTYYQLSGSLAYMLDRKGNTTIHLGVQGGQGSRGLNKPQDLVFDDQVEETAVAPVDNTDDIGDFDLNAGLLLKTKIDKTSDFNVGLSLGHLLAPDNRIKIANVMSLTPGSPGMPTADEDKLPLRLNFHAGYNRQISDKFSIHPQALFSTIAGQNEVNIQCWTGYKLDPESPLTLRGGLGHRLARDIQILLGIDYNDLRVGVAYDLNVSSLTDATGGHGGFELGLIYTGKIYKKPDVPPAILCPKL